MPIGIGEVFAAKARAMRSTAAGRRAGAILDPDRLDDYIAAQRAK